MQSSVMKTVSNAVLYYSVCPSVMLSALGLFPDKAFHFYHLEHTEAEIFPILALPFELPE